MKFKVYWLEKDAEKRKVLLGEYESDDAYHAEFMARKEHWKFLKKIHARMWSIVAEVSPE